MKEEEEEEKEDSNPLLLDHDRGNHCVTRDELNCALSWLNENAPTPSIFGRYSGRQFHKQLEDFIENLQEKSLMERISNPYISHEEEEEEEEKKEDRDSIEDEDASSQPIEALRDEGQIALMHIIKDRLTGNGRMKFGPSNSTRNMDSRATQAMNFLVNCILQGPDIMRSEEEEKDDPIKELLMEQYTAIYGQQVIGVGGFATVNRIGESSIVIKKALTHRGHNDPSKNSIINKEIRALMRVTTALLENSGTGHQKKILLQAFSLPICFLNAGDEHPQIVFWAANNNLYEWCRQRHASHKEEMEGINLPLFDHDRGNHCVTVDEPNEEEDFFKAYSQLAVNIYLALVYIHSHGIVHRDVKLENMLVKSKGNDNDNDDILIQLTDFGTTVYEFQECTDNREYGTAHQTGITPFCTSPTMLYRHRGKHNRSKKSDLENNDMWGLAVTIADAHAVLTNDRSWLPDKLSKKLTPFASGTTSNEGIIEQLIEKMETWRAEMKEISEKNSVFFELTNTRLHDLWVRRDTEDHPINFEERFDDVFSEEKRNVTGILKHAQEFMF